MDPISDISAASASSRSAGSSDPLEHSSCRCAQCCSRRTEAIIEAKDLPRGVVPAPQDTRTVTEKAVAAFEEKTGLTVVLNGKNYDYKLSSSGKDITVLSTESGAKGLEAAERELAKLTAAKQADLEKIFKVDFSKAGDDVVRQRVWKPDCTVEYGNMIKARAPKYYELLGIEVALYKMQPHQLPAEGGSKLKFHFLEDRYYKGDSILAYFIHADKDNRPAVYFEPGANAKKPITERDADRIKKHQLYSIEAVTIHELGHYHQKTSGWDNGSLHETMAKKLGWMPFLDKNNEMDFLLKGKKGEFYRLGRDKCPDASLWVQADKNGEPLGVDGKPAGSFKAAKTYSNSEVRKLAESYPPTHYFDRPKELHAEALMLFCLGDNHRESLLTNNPAIYAVIKKTDQDQTTKVYGKLPDGSPQYIRAASGYLVKNTSESRQAVEAFESNIRPRPVIIDVPADATKAIAK